MGVIRKLGDRVEKEHNQFLRDSQRLEDRSVAADGGFSGAPAVAGGVDFESLVGGANGAVKADSVIESKNWDDDVWGSIFTAAPEVSVQVSHVCILLMHFLAGSESANHVTYYDPTASNALGTFVAQASEPNSPISIGCKINFWHFI